MSAAAIDVTELSEAVSRVGAEFVTMDVSEQAAPQRVHSALASHRNWNAFVGKALSMHRGALGIQSVGKSPRRGERWSKTAGGGARRAGAVGGPPPSALPPGGGDPSDLGPQYHGDNAFTARMRLHQSHWRATVLGVPCGRGPQASDVSIYGNMLSDDAAQAGRNFLTPATFEVARRRLAEARGTIEPFRLLHNLLSSQPMCFNLFGPLVDEPERATRLLRAWIGDEVARVTSVKIEWAPAPADEYLADRTAFDAFIAYERPDGSLAGLGIETKLTDSFSQKPYDKLEYRRWMDSSRSPFRSEASSTVASPRYNQIWRNHLLAIALRDHAGSPYAATRSAVLYHPQDVGAASVLAGYRELLLAGDETFGGLTIEAVVSAFETAATGAEEQAWLAAFRARYLALERSEGAWRGRL